MHDAAISRDSDASAVVSPYYFTNQTRLTVADAFARVVDRLWLNVPACAIMNEHVHFLVWRSKYTIEYLVNQLKGAGTLALELPQTPWTRKCWKVFINDESSLRAAAEYVAANPPAAGLTAATMGFCGPVAAGQLGRRAGGR